MSKKDVILNEVKNLIPGLKTDVGRKVYLVHQIPFDQAQDMLRLRAQPACR
jgi:hypothetical protein